MRRPKNRVLLAMAVFVTMMLLWSVWSRSAALTRGWISGQKRVSWWVVAACSVLQLVCGGPAQMGPATTPSVGEVWPKPAHIARQPVYFSIDAQALQFSGDGQQCEVLQRALGRYKHLLSLVAASDRTPWTERRWRAGPWMEPAFGGNLTEIKIDLAGCDDWPSSRMEEFYKLTIGSQTYDIIAEARIVAPQVWGVLRALETFTQLAIPAGDGLSVVVLQSDVADSPRFPHRGLLLDTSRHFLPVDDIKLEMDAMEAVKLNVLHWHIVDDQSFPYQSVRFPELSAKGAFDPRLVYTPEDVAEVIEYGRLRGIRVMPEFDSPGHTRSWEAGQPGLLAACHDSRGQPDGDFANIDPTKQENLDFVSQLFGEVAATFPETLLHLGGDEVPDYCWDSDPGVRARMREKGFGSDYRRLEADYLSWLTKEVRGLNKTPVVWQEAWVNGDFQANDVIVQVWLRPSVSTSALDLMEKVTSRGFRALLSESWYLDHLDASWQQMYAVEPRGFSGSAAALALVQGGEACMWGEQVDASNVHSRVWPRAGAVAERLWSSDAAAKAWDVEEAGHRLQELVCRLRTRRVASGPADGPSFC